MKPPERYRYLILIFLLFVGSMPVYTAHSGARETLTMTGTGSSVGVMKRMAGSFEKRFPLVTVNVLPSIGSAGGIKAVTEGKIDIALSSRSLKPEERIPEIAEFPYGRTAFVFGVQASNPTEGLRLTEVEEIYAGKRRTWPDGTPIRIILRPLSDAYSVFLAGIGPGMKSASEQAHSIPGLFVGITDQEAALQIEKTPGSFGTTSAAVVAVEKLKIKGLAIDGITPEPPNVSAGRYPYAMTMSFVCKRDKYSGAVKDFIDFVFSGDGRKILHANGHLALPRAVGK